VDGVGTVSGVDRKGADHVMAIACSSDLLGDMVPKGSVALDGVSLTLVEVKTTAFTVHLIPTTRTQTTLGDAKPGQTVNIETDVLAKYVRRSVGGAPSGTPLSMADLARAGFVEG
jgi:riboflavin synthase